MEAIMAIAEKHKLYVIEDNAQGIVQPLLKDVLLFWRHRNTFIFPQQKFGRDGGCRNVPDHDDDLAAKLRQLRVHGENPKYYHKWVGLTARLILCRQLCFW